MKLSSRQWAGLLVALLLILGAVYKYNSSKQSASSDSTSAASGGGPAKGGTGSFFSTFSSFGAKEVVIANGKHALLVQDGDLSMLVPSMNIMTLQVEAPPPDGIFGPRGQRMRPIGRNIPQDKLTFGYAPDGRDLNDVTIMGGGSFQLVVLDEEVAWMSLEQLGRIKRAIRQGSEVSLSPTFRLTPFVSDNIQNGFTMTAVDVNGIPDTGPLRMFKGGRNAGWTLFVTPANGPASAGAIYPSTTVFTLG